MNAPNTLTSIYMYPKIKHGIVGQFTWKDDRRIPVPTPCDPPPPTSPELGRYRSATSFWWFRFTKIWSTPRRQVGSRGRQARPHWAACYPSWGGCLVPSCSRQDLGFSSHPGPPWPGPETGSSSSWRGFGRPPIWYHPGPDSLPGSLLETLTA